MWGDRCSRLILLGAPFLSWKGPNSSRALKNANQADYSNLAAAHLKEGARWIVHFSESFFLGPVVVVMEPSLNVYQSDRERWRVKISCSRVMGRFKALICGVGHRRSSYQKFESNGEETRDYWCYKCSQCGHHGKAKVSSLFFFANGDLMSEGPIRLLPTYLRRAH